MKQFLILSAALGLLAAMPATAARRADSEFAVKRLHDFAQCAAETREAPMKAFLRMDYDAPDYGATLRKEAGRSSRCLGFGQLKFSGVLFAGALAEIYLERAPGGAGAAIRASLAPSLPPVAARSQAELMALCVVRSKPDLVATLLATEPAQQAEAAALGDLVPALQPCLQAGMSMRLNGSAIRALTALAAWRLSDRGSRDSIMEAAR